MANNDLNNNEDILLKVDSNNLIYVDPNSVINNNVVEPRGVKSEELVMYVNLEADLVPRTTLTMSGGEKKGNIVSIAKGNLNFLNNKSGDGQLDTSWTDSFFNVTETTREINVNGTMVKEGTGDFSQSDTSGQSFGIDSINIEVKGITIPTIQINFIDVRGKTMFESPKDSPYKAFFHLPWPIFYLTVKGYYGKAIRYRLHMVSFSSKYNESNGNFEITTKFVGSTYAFLADIPLNGVMNAPYMYYIESEKNVSTNTKDATTVKKISKSSKGYAMLRSVYAEYKSKGFIDKNFPEKTLREVITIAKSLDKILEREIFEGVNMKVFVGIKEVEKIIDDFIAMVKAWQITNLKSEVFTRNNNEYTYLNGQQKNLLTRVKGEKVEGALEYIITNKQKQLKENQLFTQSYINNTGVDFKKTTFNMLTNVKSIDKYIGQHEDSAQFGIAIKSLLSDILTIKTSFNAQKTKVQDSVEEKMNKIIKDPTKGFGFEPTIRNIFAVILANADVYVRLLKDVHVRAFESGKTRKDLIGKDYSDETPNQNSIYPWPQIKKQTANSTQKEIAYPGDKDLISVLQSDNPVIWPEVEFVEEYIGVATKRVDTMAEKEGGVGKINFVFEKNASENDNKPVSTLMTMGGGLPYTDRGISSTFYEIYDRARYTTLLDSFSNNTLGELAEKEFDNISKSFEEDYDFIDMIKTVTGTTKLINYLYSFSPFERYPYYTDKMATTPYIKNSLDTSFEIVQHFGNPNKMDLSLEYEKTSQELKNFKAEQYRTSVFPFNSDLNLSYIKQKKYDISYLTFYDLFKVDTKEGFISAPNEPLAWINSAYSGNMFSYKLQMSSTESVNILNTPYFHKQLYSDFNNSKTFGKYVGSAYLLLNSLPYQDLENYVFFSNTSARMSAMFKELGASHYVPYHLMLKWGSLYHRYKTKLTTDVDILSGFLTGTTTQSISGKTFFDGGYTGTSFTTFTVSGDTGLTYTSNKNIGLHPVYENIFHQIINGYEFYDLFSGNTSFSATTKNGIYNSRKRTTNDKNFFTSYVDNQVITEMALGVTGTTGNTYYTLLPTDGSNAKEVLESFETDYNNNEQNNLRIVWYGDETVTTKYSGKTFNNYNQYLKSYLTGSTEDNKFYVLGTYRKVMDLMGTFSPAILDKFEEYFIEFASEKENVEVKYDTFPSYTDDSGYTHKVKYDNFQDLLKELVTVKKDSETDGKTTMDVINSIRTKQLAKHQDITRDIMSADNMIKITISNPKEINLNVWDGIADVSSGNTFNLNYYKSSDYTANTQKLLDLYLGENPITGGSTNYYKEFFVTNDIELNEDNILLLRPLIYIYAGGKKEGKFTNKSTFQSYLINNVLLQSELRLNVYLDRLTQLIAKKLKPKDNRGIKKQHDGYNNEPLKIELYNYFKSFNDKWASGNSIGQKGLLEEFLFLDKANRDIGNIAYLNLENLIALDNQYNSSMDLYSVCGNIIKDTGFDMRCMPAYVNFYGTNYSNKSKLTPSKKVARNLFGTFLEVDYQESSPKVILQYIGLTSKYQDMSNISADEYLYNDDSFCPSDLTKNPLLITIPNAFNSSELLKSNKVVAFEVSIGDQNQSIFKGIELNQDTIKNTSESFPVLEMLARSETGAAVASIDTSLYDVWRQASYSCTITMLGDVQIQPTMYFYLKNVPMFKGTYYITEVSHNIKGNSIKTSFKGTKIPYSALPNPKDTFTSSYRVLFDKITNSAIAKLKEQGSQTGTTETSITTNKGTSVIDMGAANKAIPNETLVKEAGVSNFGVLYNGFKDSKYVQKVKYNGDEYLRAIVSNMGGTNYKIEDSIEMSLINRVTSKTISGSTSTPNKILWKDIKSSTNYFYATNFDFSSKSANDIIKGTTTFLNPKENVKLVLGPITESNINTNTIQGPINVGPSTKGYGIGMSNELMKDLSLYDGDVVYFKIQ